jgi:hypothetical protein
MSADNSSRHAHPEDRYPVAVMMERRERSRGGWSFTEWKVTGILPEEATSGKPPARMLVREESGWRRYLWRHFVIELVKDGAESYWNNLMASEPSLFVVCREDEEFGELAPFLVTANYDEIIGYQEVDDQVFSLPIPADIYRWLEHYVVNNYVPPQPRKRKRVKWVNGNEPAAAPARRH